MATELPRRPRYGAEGQQPYWVRELCTSCPLWADVTIEGAPLCADHALSVLRIYGDTDPHIEGQLFPWTEDSDRWRT